MTLFDRWLDRVVVTIVALILLTCSGPTTPEPLGPAAVVTFDTVYTLGGRNFTADLRLIMADDARERIDSLDGFDFVIRYDPEIMIFQNALRSTDATSAWEYFTWRTGLFGSNGLGPRFVRVLSIRDMNNGQPVDPSQARPSGVIASLEFFAVDDPSLWDRSFELSFESFGCGDNVLTSAADHSHYYIADPAYNEVPTAEADTSDCDSFVVLTPAVKFMPGIVHYVPPPDDRPDTLVINWPHGDSTILIWPGTDSQVVIGYWPF